MGRVRKQGSGTIWLEKRGCALSRELARAKLKEKLLTPDSRDNNIRTDVVAVAALTIIMVFVYLNKPM